MHVLTEQTALFIACLGRDYRTISSAISAHTYVQRVAPLCMQVAEGAIASALQLGVVEQNVRGEVRLAPKWSTKLDQLEESEGGLEVAEYEMSLILLEHQTQSGGT